MGSPRPRPRHLQETVLPGKCPLCLQVPPISQQTVPSPGNPQAGRRLSSQTELCPKRLGCRPQHGGSPSRQVVGAEHRALLSTEMLSKEDRGGACPPEGILRQEGSQNAPAGGQGARRGEDSGLWSQPPGPMNPIKEQNCTFGEPHGHHTFMGRWFSGSCWQEGRGQRSHPQWTQGGHRRPRGLPHWPPAMHTGLAPQADPGPARPDTGQASARVAAPPRGKGPLHACDSR